MVKVFRFLAFPWLSMRLPILVLVSLSLFPASFAVVVELSPKEIPGLVKESCVILVAKTASPQTLKVIQSLSDKVLGDIPVIAADWDEFHKEKVKLNVPGLSQSSELVVLERKFPDRTCLVSTNLSFTHISGTAFIGLVTEESVMDFVNRGCNTFWGLDGSLTTQGLHREKILGNLFSVPPNYGSDGISMHELAEKCGDLKEFFRSGSCGGDTVDFCPADQICRSKVELPECERVSRLPSEREFFDEYLSRGKPVILEGAAKSWPAFTSWTKEFLREKFGETEVHIKLTPPEGDFEGVEPRKWWNRSHLEVPKEVLDQIQFPDLITVRPHGVDMKLEDFLDLVEKKKADSDKASAYMEYTPIADYMKGLENDTMELDFVKGMLELRLRNMWLSDGNTLGKLHMDQFDNFLSQISGRKQVILIEPWNNEKLYEGHIFEGMLRYENGEFHRDKLLESTSLTMSPVDITKPDFKRFPKFGNVHPLNCTIGEGDVLYLPSYWWHEVQSYPSTQDDRNLAVNFWYEPFLWKEFPCAQCKFDINRKYRDLL